jgi:hypothetical protein
MLVWQKGHTPKGYGNMCFMNRRWKVPKIVIWLTNGALQPGMWVLHKCDTPACANPAHLFFGTAKDNVQDSISKGRFKRRRGSDVYNAKLTDDAVRVIRRTFKTGSRESGTKPLARRFGVSPRTIEAVIDNKTWRGIS